MKNSQEVKIIMIMIKSEKNIVGYKNITPEYRNGNWHRNMCLFREKIILQILGNIVSEQNQTNGDKKK